MPPVNKMLALAALLAIPASAGGAGRNLRKKNRDGNDDGGRNRRLRRGRINHVDGLTKKNAGGGGGLLEEDVRFFTNLVRRTQDLSMPPTDPPVADTPGPTPSTGGEITPAPTPAAVSPEPTPAMTVVDPTPGPTPSAGGEITPAPTPTVVSPEPTPAITVVDPTPGPTGQDVGGPSATIAPTYVEVTDPPVAVTDPPAPFPTLPPVTDAPIAAGIPTLPPQAVITNPPVPVGGIICAEDESCAVEGDICSDGTTEECCGETFDSFQCECVEDAEGSLAYECDYTDACVGRICDTGPPMQGPAGPTPPPVPDTGGFKCPDPNVVGCTAVDPSNPTDECPTVGEECEFGNPGEFCCEDGCPRNYCTAKQAPMSASEFVPIIMDLQAGEIEDAHERIDGGV